MRRKSIYIKEEQNNFLDSLDDMTVSEHIRRAIDEYIEKRRVKSSTSPTNDRPVMPPSP